MSSIRLGVVLSHPTQYYGPWFRWLQGRERLVVRVFYLWDFGVASRRDPEFGRAFAWDIDLLSGYESEFVPNRSARPGTDRFSGLRNPSLHARLTAWRPDAILLFGYRYATHVSLIRWARKRRIPLIFRGDSHLLGRQRPPLAKRLLLRRLYRRFAAITYVGAANRTYFEFFGVPSERLFFCPHAVDAGLFDPARPDLQRRAAALRSELGLAPNRRVVLFAGKLVARKQPGVLLDAFLAAAPSDATLLFVGEGEEKSRVRERAARAAPADVRLLPFANQSEMPAWYLLADLFVLPSSGHSETWGLVVNEAMHMGVPCLVSDRVGCQQDLVTDGETGWVFPAGDREQLAVKLCAALDALHRDAAEWKARVAARIAGYTYVQATAGLAQAVRHATDHRAP